MSAAVVFSFLMFPLAAVTASAAGMTSYNGKFGESFYFPDSYTTEFEMVKGIEVIRFFPRETGITRQNFTRPEEYAPRDLMQLLVIPKRNSKVSSIQEVREAKETELGKKKIWFKILPAKAFSPGSFFVRVQRPYKQTHAYIEGDHYFFSVISGRIGPLFKEILGDLVGIASNLKPAKNEEPRSAPPKTNDPKKWALETLKKHRFRLTEAAAEELKIPRVVTIKTYLMAFTKVMERNYGVESDKKWEVERVKDDLYRVKHRVKMLQAKIFKKKFKFAWHVDIRSHEIKGLNRRSKIFFLPETQVE